MNANLMQTSDLTNRVAELWKSGRQILWWVGDELARYRREVQEAAKRISEERREQDPDQFRAVKVVSHDRWAGFHVGLPNVPQCKDKTNVLGNALQIAVMSREQIAEQFDGVDLPFDPEEDLIFVFQSVDEEIKGQPPVLTLLRDIQQCNMCSPSYVEDKEVGTRGARMIIIVTATTEMPSSIPELKPEIVPLPGLPALRATAMDVLEPLFEAHKKSKGNQGVKPLNEAELASVVNAMCGMTAQDAEEALSYALVKHRGIGDLDDFINTIEHEKAKVIASIPGLTYVPKEQITSDVPPGYGPLIEAMDLYTDEDGKCHLRGLSLGGPPGVAKTVTAKFIARHLKRIALILDVGAAKGSLVGETEKNFRRAIQIADALMAVLILDDVDKGGVNKGNSYGGDGGTTGNTIQSLLTKMSDPFCNIIFVFTFNRVPELPELIRLGRVDIRVYVEEPKNAATRLAIFRYGLKQYGVTVDDEEKLAALAGKPTEGMTGAEIIHGVIKPAWLKAKKAKGTVLDLAFMLKQTEGFTPMLQQKKYQADLAQMREDLSQFTRIGNVPDDAAPAAGESRASSRRRTSLA